MRIAMHATTTRKPGIALAAMAAKRNERQAAWRRENDRRAAKIEMATSGVKQRLSNIAAAAYGV